MKRATAILLLTLAASLTASLSHAGLAEAPQFDWAAFIKKKQPKEVKDVSIFVGGPHPFQRNASTMRFRPASTLKIFTAAAYLEKIGWNKEIPPFLKRSVNSIGDDKLVPELGGGDFEKGTEAVEDYVNATIKAALKRRGITIELRSCTDEYSRVVAKKNPYQVVCESGSGIDGAVSRLKGQNLDRSLVTAEAMRVFLEELRRKDYFLKILRSLPYAGTDGTLRARMNDETADGKVAAKTGTLDGIKNIAGYVHVIQDGESAFIPFVILVRHNQKNVAKIVTFSDTLINKMAEELGAKKIPYDPLD